jgi:hypothetical protein
MDVVKGLFGGGSQDKLLRQQQRELDAVEAGQRRLREGGRGLLAYIDEELGSAFGSGGGSARSTDDDSNDRTHSRTNFQLMSRVSPATRPPTRTIQENRRTAPTVRKRRSMR